MRDVGIGRTAHANRRYRSQIAYDRKFGRNEQPPSPGGAARKAAETSGGGGVGAAPTYSVGGYLEHQGNKFVERFDANCYVALTRLIDSHDVGRGRGGVPLALSGVRCPVLVIGISSDVLYPLEMQRELASLLPKGTLRIVYSPQGHDGFLLEGTRIGALVSAALDADCDEPFCISDVTSDDAESPTPRGLGGAGVVRPRTQKEMNEALAECAIATSKRTNERKKKPAPMLSPQQEWFFGI